MTISASYKPEAGTPERKLIFAPLIRVSTEDQEKQGESLQVQKEQLTRAVEILGGEVFRWYEGQEHATPDYERRILEELMADAQARRFDAVIVADLSRWSRDNGKSKEYTKLLRKAGVRFFEGSMEIDLYNPSHSLVLGMGVEIQEFFASQQAYKSILSRIARAKQGLPACGKLPYGRTWDPITRVWGVDLEKQAIVRKSAKLYLIGDYSWQDLGKMFGMNASNLCKILCHRSGAEWEQRFISKRHGIDETVITKVPRLLPEETIRAIRKKSEARGKWDKKTQKHQYLFARVIFDMDTGRALTGTSNRRGQRYYKPYQGCTNRYQINADILEKAVLGELFRALGSKTSFHQAVFDGHPMGRVADKIREDLETKRGELKSVEARIENYLTTIETSNDVVALLNRIKPKLAQLEVQSKALRDEIAALKYRLAAIPDEAEIEIRRDKWRAALLDAHMTSYLKSGIALWRLPFEVQKKIVRLIFGGKDEMGRRYGVYVQDLGGTPKRYRFEAYGRLGSIKGEVHAKSGEYFSGSYELKLRDDKELGEGISRVILNSNSMIFKGISEVKVDMLSERHAYNGQRVH